MKKFTFLTLLSTLVLCVATLSALANAPKMGVFGQPKVPARLLGE